MAAGQALIETASEYWFSRSSRYETLLLSDKDEVAKDAIPVTPVTQAGLEALTLEPLHAGWVRTSKFKGKAGEVCLLPSAQGNISRVLLGLGPSAAGGEPWPFAVLAKLPGGTYQLEALAAGAEGVDAAAASAVADRAALGFLLGHYAFERYKGSAAGLGATAAAGGAATAEAGEPEAKARLVWPAGCNRTHVTALARGFVWARDLITTPAEDLGPQHLAAEAAALAAQHGASFHVLQGDELLEHNYPAIHTVGRASYRPPLLAALEWSPPGSEAAAGAGGEPLPVLALVGKGVCFDTGGLDLKPAASMKNMKKDMGGAALVLALAHAVMAARLRCRLRVLVPAVENAVAGNAFRPLDVLHTRAGITVENGNTDAEGRLILADALADALGRDSRRTTANPDDANFQLPDLLIDAATLTGAARVALGADLPAVFSNDDDTWRALEAAAAATGDPVWRLPLHAPYRKSLDSKIADLSSTGAGDGLAGAIIAALFLQEFAKGAPRWLHIDTNAFNVGGAVGPGRPEGGEAQGLRALFAMLSARYGTAA